MCMHYISLQCTHKNAAAFLEKFGKDTLLVHIRFIIIIAVVARVPVQVIYIFFFNTQNYQFRQWSKQSNILQHSNSTGIDSVGDEESHSRWPKSYFQGMLSSFHLHSTTSIHHLHDTAKLVTSTFILSNT